MASMTDLPSRSSVAQWSRSLNRPQCLLAWQADGSRRPGFKSRSGREFFGSIGLAGMLRLNSRTGIEGLPVSSLNCDRSLHSGLKAPELVMDADCRDNRWAASLCTWPPGCSPLVLPPSQEVDSTWVSLSLVVDAQVKACSRETHSPSRASKTYGHNAFQNTPLLSTVVAHILLNTAHTVGSDCSYNPGWFRSHPAVSEMT